MQFKDKNKGYIYTQYKYKIQIENVGTINSYLIDSILFGNSTSCFFNVGTSDTHFESVRITSLAF